MKLKRVLFLACGIAALAAFVPRAALSDDIDGAVQVGQKAPPFELKDQNGDEHSLAEMLKHGKVALVFYRSASW